MKAKILGVGLFVATAAAVAIAPFYEPADARPSPPTEPPKNAHQASADPAKITIAAPAAVEVVFVLDTTGSMGGLIGAAKEKIWSIATTLASAQSSPTVKMGLVAYRDRGDEYVTRQVDLSDDLDSVYARLMDLEAAGGGDTPESVNQALYEAVHNMAWSADQNTYRVIFLVGDAPPQMGYQQDVKFPQTTAQAKARGIRINTIQAGNMVSTTQAWQHIAQLADGQYLKVGQAGSAIAIVTPYDEKLATLSRKLDATRLYYGTEEERKAKDAKIRATEKLHERASLAARARRAEFNTSKAGGANLIGEGELVDDVASGRVALESVAPASLPAPLLGLDRKAQAEVISQKREAREELSEKIRALVEQRTAFLKEKVDRLGGAKDSLDRKLYDTVRSQAAGIGLRYDADEPKY